MQPNRRKIRRGPPRGMAPPDVPEVVAEPLPVAPATEPDPIPDHIRKMLEAAYT